MLFALVFVVLLPFVVCNKPDPLRMSEFDKVVVLRAFDTVNQFLSNPNSILDQIRTIHQLGLLSKDDLSLLLLTQLRASPLIQGIDMWYLNGTLTGYTKTDSGEVYVSISNDDPNFVKMFLVDSYGHPSTQIWQHEVYQALVERSPQTYRSQGFGFLWSAPSRISEKDMGVTVTTSFNDTKGEFAGVVSVTLALGVLDTYLNTEFNTQGDGQLVVVVLSGDHVIATSVDGLSAVSTPNGVMVDLSQAANQDHSSPDYMVFSSASFLHQVNLTRTWCGSFEMFVHDDLATQVGCFNLPSQVNWLVLAVRPASFKPSYWTHTDTTFFGLALVSLLATMTTLFCLWWMVWYRKMLLWASAHYRALAVVLSANALSCVACILLIHSPSKVNCVGWQWVAITSLLWNPVALLMKSLCVLATPSNNFFKTPLITRPRIVGCVAALMALHIVFEICETVYDRWGVRARYVEDHGEVVYEVTCTQNVSLLWLHDMSVLCVCIAGVITALQTPKVANVFDESRGLVAMSCVITLTTLLVFVCHMLMTPGDKLLSGLWILALLMETFLFQATLFVPRIYRQLTLGDLTASELRSNLLIQLAESRRASHEHMLGQLPNGNTGAGVGGVDIPPVPIFGVVMQQPPANRLDHLYLTPRSINSDDTPPPSPPPLSPSHSPHLSPSISQTNFSASTTKIAAATAALSSASTTTTTTTAPSSSKPSLSSPPPPPPPLSSPSKDL